MSEAKNNTRSYTWNDYRSWDDGRRWEVIDGTAFDMSPAPSLPHQHIAGEIFGQMREFFKGRKCKPFIAPADVKLSDADIVQPDVFVVCQGDKIKESHLDGAPDLVVEVLSPWTARHDRLSKMDLYARHGVKEVWLVTPEPSMVELLVLHAGKFTLEKTYGDDGVIESPSFPGLRIDLSSVFDFEPRVGESPLRFLKDPSDPYALMAQAGKEQAQ